MVLQNRIKPNLALRVMLLVLLAAWSGNLLGLQGATRVWSDSTGSFKTEAALAGYDGHNVTLRRVDNGQIVIVPVSKLSDADREFLRVSKKVPSAESGSPVDTTPWLKKGKWVVYHVNMKATMTVPANRELKQLQLRHALPTPREWSTPGAAAPGALNIRMVPDSGKQKFARKEDSHFVLYDLKKGIESGTALEFNTGFDVTSCEREFVPSVSQTAWEDYGKPKKNTEPTRLPVDLKEWVATIRAEHTPAEAVAKFCEWNATHLTYDASVPWYSTQLDRTLQSRRGHCGHYCELTAEFCSEAGIPSRRVFGLNLYEEDGDGELSRIRLDFTNIHTWIEVFLPKEGWIELEPADAENPFRIPARFIQNNPEIQNYELAFREGGEMEIHQFKPGGMNGSFLSEFGFGNLITYTVESVPDPYAKPATESDGVSEPGK